MCVYLYISVDVYIDMCVHIYTCFFYVLTYLFLYTYIVHPQAQGLQTGGSFAVLLLGSEA